jgi:disulfide bond formation protein DsbB
MIRRLIDRLGVQRVLLDVVIVLLIILAPFAGGETAYSGWRMMPTLIAPALAPIFLFVLPLDMTMSAIFMSAKDLDERRRYRFIIITDFVLLAVLVAVWVPFFVTLVAGPG